MSLDVYLYSKKPIEKKGTGVFIREGGKTIELTAEQVKEKWPDSEVVEQDFETTEVFWKNITHNLNRMANAAGIYTYLWTPDAIGITTARELIDPLREGLHRLKMEPDKYMEFNPHNGWGHYDGLVSFVEEYLNACYQYPDATISVSR